MDRKREVTSVDVAALARELDVYAGAHLDKAYLYDDRPLLRLKLSHHDHDRVELLAETGERKWVSVVNRDNVPPAPERPPNFAMMLRNRLEGAKLAAVEQFEFDRILTLRFERRTDATTIVLELFGDGNVVVLDADHEVIDCLRTVRLKSRTVAPGSIYEFPTARFDPLTVDEATFRERMTQSDADVVRTLATQLNFGGTYGEELCTRAGVPYNQPMAETDEEELGALFAAVDDLAGRIRTGDLDPRVYFEAGGEGGADGGTADGDTAGGSRGERVDATPLPLEEYDRLPAEPHDNFTAALDDYFTALARTDARDGEGGGGGAAPERPDFESEISKHEHIVEQQEGAIEEYEREADDRREQAQALYANYDLVDGVLSTVREARADDVGWDAIADRFEVGAEQGIAAAEAVEGVDGENGTVTLTLDEHRVTLEVSEGVEHNADRLYTDAKAKEQKAEGAREAVAETREQLAEIRERRDAWEAQRGDGSDDGGASGAEAGTDSDDASDSDGEDDDAPTDWLALDSVPVRTTDDWYEEFRWFHTSDGFLVIGGRNADQNEALVEKYLEPGDRFFHAQAHGGPVTILKATGPSEPAEQVDFPETSRQQAATFAVSYSSVWKDGRFAGDVYAVDPDQVSKTPESGEYLEKGGFAVRGDRTYYRDQAVDVAVGIACEDRTRVVGGPSDAVATHAATTIELEPGRYAANDVAKKCYREFRERFVDESFVRKVASPDRIGEFLPPGTSHIVD